MEFPDVIDAMTMFRVMERLQLRTDLFQVQDTQVNFHNLGPVHQAVIRNDRHRLQALLKRGESCNACDEELEMTPLQLASRKGNVTIVKILLDAGANVHHLDDECNTILHLAVAGNNLEVLRLLLALKSIDVDAKNNKGFTALHVASEVGTVTMIEALLAAGANINAKSTTLITPLCLSILSKRSDVFNILLSAGANVNTADRQFMTPLHVAVMIGFPLDGIRQLIANSANINARCANYNIPLHLMFFSENGCHQVAQLLLENGSNVNAKNRDGNTALHLTAALKLVDEDRRVQIARVLVEHGANVNDLNYCQHWSPLHCAIKTSSKGVALFLMENGADINIGAPDAVTPLHMAVLHSLDSVKIDLVNALLKYGADPNAKEELGRIPLHFAVENNSDISVVRTLLASGSCFDAKSDMGTKRLPAELAAAHGLVVIRELLALIGKFFQAICKNDVEKVKKYLEADKFLVHCRSAHHKTPLHFPAWKGFAEMTSLLLNHGADPNEANSIYSSPLHYAAKYDHSRLMEDLIRNGAKVNAICPLSKKTPKMIAQDHKSLACLMVLVSIEQIFEGVAAGDLDAIKQIDYFKNMGVGPLRVLRGARNTEGKRLIDIALEKNQEEIVIALSSGERKI